jgi:hypothetical protein
LLPFDVGRPGVAGAYAYDRHGWRIGRKAATQNRPNG